MDAGLISEIVAFFLQIDLFRAGLKMGKTSKNICAKWSEEQLQVDLTATQNNQSQRSVAQRFGIPRRILRNHLRSGKITKHLGWTAVLSRDQEIEFASRIIRYCKVGMPLTPLIVRHQVF